IWRDYASGPRRPGTSRGRRPPDEAPGPGTCGLLRVASRTSPISSSITSSSVTRPRRASGSGRGTGSADGDTIRSSAVDPAEVDPAGVVSSSDPPTADPTDVGSA